jgi:redox-sensitive bicupin YhaK (pirin superfamily)
MTRPGRAATMTPTTTKATGNRTATTSRESAPKNAPAARPKKLARVYKAPQGHWVGDGFPVRSMFSYHAHGHSVSPFLLLDYAGPAEFAPAARPRGVGMHPHRGFETVTIVYQGAVDHKDTAGNAGSIGPGDVQWMTAAKGVLHEEMHGKEFTKNGGALEMVQLWVNLPAKHKMSKPGYQEILNANIPTVALDDKGSIARVIAGELHGAKGPARSFTPVNLWDLRLAAGSRVELAMPDGHTAMLLAMRGRLRVGGERAGDSEQVGEAELAVFEREGARFVLEADADATVLVLGGEPIDEPIAGYGPFVMNTDAEIAQAISDFNSGKF